jgi:2-polyprenyl-3-methyl-5-hydroxy-6-metoxy-1,4-benzoquinol methylase
MSDYYFNLERHDMLPFVPLGRGRVLEIGCGEGRFSAALTGVEESWGIEPSPAAEVAKGSLTKVIRGTFKDAEPKLPTSYFDLVICNDLIEHMSDYSRFLSSIGKYIAPGGMIIGSIPNVRFYNNMLNIYLKKIGVTLISVFLIVPI